LAVCADSLWEHNITLPTVPSSTPKGTPSSKNGNQKIKFKINASEIFADEQQVVLMLWCQPHALVARRTVRWQETWKAQSRRQVMLQYFASVWIG